MDKDSIIEELIQTISTYHSWGWSPATSTNYSFVDETSKIWVTISGIDKSRITKIKKYVDHLLVIFPFEVAFYKRHNLDVLYVGNPLLDEIKKKQFNKILIKTKNNKL